MKKVKALNFLSSVLLRIGEIMQATMKIVRILITVVMRV